MIRRMEVKGLNKRVDHAWEFNEDLNIITGRNGSGKTTLLKLMWYLISGNLERIIPEILFQSVAVETDSFSVSIQIGSDKGKLLYQFAGEAEVDLAFEIPWRRVDDERIYRLNRRIAGTMNNSLFFPTFRRIEGGFAEFSRYLIDSNLAAYPPDRFRRRRADRVTEMLQEGMSRLSDEVSTSDDHKFIASISTHDIGELLREKYADVSSKTIDLHVALSEDITQKISKRKASDDARPVLEDIQKRVEQVTEQRESLLRPFSVLGERIREIFHNKGIHVTSGITLGDAEEAIESDKLSGGEKQMLSFLCYNTFSEKTSIFIDEPELSLHIDWQRRLLPTLLEQRTGNQFFVATHSPFIFATYPNKEFLLGEDRGGDA